MKDRSWIYKQSLLNISSIVYDKDISDKNAREKIKDIMHFLSENEFNLLFKDKGFDLHK